MYILNHTNTTLSVGQFADIPPGKYIKADKYILESAETAYAVRANWASLHDSPPKEIAFEGEAINFEKATIEGTTEYPGAEPEAKPEKPAEKEKEVEVEKEAEPEAKEEAPAKKTNRKSSDA